MKINWNIKYTTIAVYSVLSVCFIIVFYLSLSKIDIVTGKLSEITGILQPFIIGFIIAYLLDFLLRFFENKVFENATIDRYTVVAINGTKLFRFNKKSCMERLI